MRTYVIDIHFKVIIAFAVIVVCVVALYFTVDTYQKQTKSERINTIHIFNNQGEIVCMTPLGQYSYIRKDKGWVIYKDTYFKNGNTLIVIESCKGVQDETSK